MNAVFEAKDIEIIDDEADEYIGFFETDEYREISATTTVGDVVRICRENRGWSQAKLGRALGGMSRQNVSDMGRSSRREYSRNSS